MKIQTFYDQSELVRDSIASVRDAILIGLVLAAIILVLFLRDWGSSLVAALVIPATIAITLIALRLMGQSFNLMTLGGLAAAVGLVIDDAIVVVENIVLHRDSGQSRARGDSQRAARNSRAAGRLDRHAHRRVSAADLHHRRHRNLLPRAGRHRWHRAADIAGAGPHVDPDAQPLPAAREGRIRPRRCHGHVATTGFMGRVTRIYDRALRFVLAYPLVLALGCVGPGRWRRTSATRRWARDLLPAMDEGGFILDYLMPAGSSLDDTNEVLLGVEKILQSTPEVESTSRRTGLQLGLAAVTEANTGDFSVRLKRDREPRASKKSFPMCARRSTRSIRSWTSNSSRCCKIMIGDLTDSPEPMEIKLFSQDPNLLKEWAPKIGEKLKKIKGVVDVKDGIENTISGSAIVMNVDPVVAARAGFTSAGDRAGRERDSARRARHHAGGRE